MQSESAMAIVLVAAAVRRTGSTARAAASAVLLRAILVAVALAGKVRSWVWASKVLARRVAVGVEESKKGVA